MAFNKQSFSTNRDRNSRERGFGPRPSFGGRPRFDNRGPVEMHKAICDNCGRECEVPFRPTSGKPIFCSNCFENQRRGSDSREGGGRNFESSNLEEKRMYDAICDNCGNKCSVPFQPRGDKPIYCSNCFEKRNNGGDRSNENRNRGVGELSQYKSDFEALNSKLDAILKILTPLTSTDKIPEAEVITATDDQPVQVETMEKKKRSKKTPLSGKK